MRNSQGLFFILKRSSLCTFLICMTVSLTGTITIKILLLCNTKNTTINNKSAIHLRSFKEGLVLISVHCKAFVNLHKWLKQLIRSKNNFVIIWICSNLKLHSKSTGSSQVQILPFEIWLSFSERTFFNKYVLFSKPLLDNFLRGTLVKTRLQFLRSKKKVHRQIQITFASHLLHYIRGDIKRPCSSHITIF